MLEDYPLELKQFVEQQIAAGRFRSVDEFAVEAADLFRRLDAQHQRLQQDVQAGVDELEAGSFTEVQGSAALSEFFGGLKDRARQRLEQSTGGE